MCSRIDGSAGCSASFQSPWPYAASAVPPMTRRSISANARSTCCHTVGCAARLLARRWKNGTRSSSSAASPEAITYWAEREQRPEHDVAVRVAGADRALALEEHEPLRPIAVRILRTHHAQQQIAHRRGVAEREQHLERALTDIARAPPAARVLLETPRRRGSARTRCACTRARCRQAARPCRRAALAAGGIMRSVVFAALRRIGLQARRARHVGSSTR